MLLDERNINYEYLPPYYPFLNPIEQAFNHIKFAAKEELDNVKDKTVSLKYSKLKLGATKAQILIFSEIIT